MAKSIGTWFEGKVKDACDVNREKHGLFYYRIYDTKSAGNFLPNNPADFLLGYRGKGLLLECKASEKHTSLVGGVRELVGEDQAAYLEWWEKVGNPSRVLFYSDRLGQIESWPGRAVAYSRTHGTRLVAGSDDVRMAVIDNLPELLLWLLFLK